MSNTIIRNPYSFTATWTDISGWETDEKEHRKMLATHLDCLRDHALYGDDLIVGVRSRLRRLSGDGVRFEWSAELITGDAPQEEEPVAFP